MTAQITPQATSVQVPTEGRVCVGKTLSCSGCNPCQGCLKIYFEAVILPALIAAQPDEMQARAFFDTFDAMAVRARQEVAQSLQQVQVQQAIGVQEVPQQEQQPQEGASVSQVIGSVMAPKVEPTITVENGSGTRSKKDRGAAESVKS